MRGTRRMIHKSEEMESGKSLFSPGDRFGDCTVVRLLGGGGMGSVWQVESPSGAFFALKILDPELLRRRPSYKERFIQEAVFAMGVRHANIVTVHDAGEDAEKGLCYILMDYMPGGSLKALLEKRGTLPVEEAVSIASRIAHALDAAHKRGVIHRDVKPDNILFDAAGEPRLADLGVAKYDDDSTDTIVTAKGFIIGTPAYMAPEQMMNSHSIDARADIYSLGVVLYEMLTGTRPNAGGTVMEMLAKAIRGDPLPDVRTMRPEVSAAVAYVLSAMCAPKPDDRPKTSGAAADLLVRADAGHLLLPADGEQGDAPRKSWFKRIFGGGR